MNWLFTRRWRALLTELLGAAPWSSNRLAPKLEILEDRIALDATSAGCSGSILGC